MVLVETEWGPHTGPLWIDSETCKLFNDIQVTCMMLDIKIEPQGADIKTWMNREKHPIKLGTFQWMINSPIRPSNGDGIYFVLDFLYDELYHVYEIIVWENTGDWNWLSHTQNGYKTTYQQLQMVYKKMTGVK